MAEFTLQALEEKALQLLNIMPRTVFSLRQKLLKTYGPEHSAEIDDLILRFQEYGYLNDRAYCEELFRYIRNDRPMGPAGIRQECYKRGVPKALCEEYLRTLYEEDFLEMAVLCLHRRGGKIGSDVKEQNRAMQYLARRGFSWSVIRKALSEVRNADTDVYTDFFEESEEPYFDDEI